MRKWIVYITVTILFFSPLVGEKIYATSSMTEEKETYIPTTNTDDQETSPLHQRYEIKGWNIYRYYFNRYSNLFVEFPWVVRVSYTIVLCCCTGLIILMCILCIHFYKHKRNERQYENLKKLYLEKLKGICYAETENLPIEEISRRLNYQDKNWKDWQLRLWIYIFIEASNYTNTLDHNLTNIQRAMQLIGVTEYAERLLEFGKNHTKVRVIQAVRLTNMQLPDSLMARLVNQKNKYLRKAARLYYMGKSKETPYMYLEETNDSTRQISIWDKMEMHEVFQKINEAKNPPPLFIPFLQNIKNPEIGSFMIQETAYWGSDTDMRYLYRYFNADEPQYRQASFISMGIRKFKESEEQMKEVFFLQSEPIRRYILQSMLSIKSGDCVPFFIEAFEHTTSWYTKRTALRCLWLYGNQGRIAFNQLRAKAPKEEGILFEHVENPIINNDTV